jgi:hypothetical protein
MPSCLRNGVFMSKDPLPRLRAIRDAERRVKKQRPERDQLIAKAVRIYSQRTVSIASGLSQPYISSIARKSDS